MVRSDSSSTRARKTISIAMKAERARLASAVLAAIGRSSRWPTTNRTPSAISRQRFVPGFRSGFSSRFRMPPTKSADSANPTASRTNATGAVRIAMIWPARLGPATCDTDRTPSSLALPSIRFSRPTRCGR